MKYKTLKLLLLISLMATDANAMNKLEEGPRQSLTRGPSVAFLTQILNPQLKEVASPNAMILNTIIETINTLPSSDTKDQLIGKLNASASTVREVSYSLAAEIIAANAKDSGLIEERFFHQVVRHTHSEAKLLYLLAGLVPNLFTEGTQIESLSFMSPKKAASKIAFGGTFPIYRAFTFGPNLLKSLTNLTKHQASTSSNGIFKAVGRIEKNGTYPDHPFKKQEIASLIAYFALNQEIANYKQLKILAILYQACQEHFNQRYNHLRPIITTVTIGALLWLLLPLSFYVYDSAGYCNDNGDTNNYYSLTPANYTQTLNNIYSLVNQIENTTRLLNN